MRLAIMINLHAGVISSRGHWGRGWHRGERWLRETGNSRGSAGHGRGIGYMSSHASQPFNLPPQELVLTTNFPQLSEKLPKLITDGCQVIVGGGGPTLATGSSGMAAAG
jgi:hypothetical protein